MIERKYLGDRTVRWSVTIAGYGFNWVHRAGAIKMFAVIGITHITQVYRVGESPFDNREPGWKVERNRYIRL